MTEFAIVVGCIIAYILIGKTLFIANYHFVKGRHANTFKKQWPGLSAEKYWKDEDKKILFAIHLFAWPLYYAYVGISSVITRSVDEIEE